MSDSDVVYTNEVDLCQWPFSFELRYSFKSARGGNIESTGCLTVSVSAELMRDPRRYQAYDWVRYTSKIHGSESLNP